MQSKQVYVISIITQTSKVIIMVYLNIRQRRISSVRLETSSDQRTEGVPTNNRGRIWA